MPDWYLRDRKGEMHLASFRKLTKTDILFMRRLGWEPDFDWSIYLTKSHPSTAYKLVNNVNNAIEGAIAFRDDEGFVYVNLMECAPHNRTNHRNYINTPDILLGEACRRSFEIGGEGYINFQPKSNKEMYYAMKFGARPTGRGHMFIGSLEAMKILNVYYK